MSGSIDTCVQAACSQFARSRGLAELCLLPAPEGDHLKVLAGIFEVFRLKVELNIYLKTFREGLVHTSSPSVLLWFAGQE